MTDETKIAALAKYLDADPEEFFAEKWGQISWGREEWEVLTDEEADAKAEESIAESVWAFRPEFLAAHSDADVEVFETLQGTNKCESLNGPVRSLIRDWDRFVQDAIQADGRGHFLNTYDGEEHELSDGLYAYRVN